MMIEIPVLMDIGTYTSPKLLGPDGTVITTSTHSAHTHTASHPDLIHSHNLIGGVDGDDLNAVISG